MKLRLKLDEAWHDTERLSGEEIGEKTKERNGD
jgi:hypothetical protein